jgi:hypothetical protein
MVNFSNTSCLRKAAALSTHIEECNSSSTKLHILGNFLFNCALYNKDLNRNSVDSGGLQELKPNAKVAPLEETQPSFCPNLVNQK